MTPQEAINFAEHIDREADPYHRPFTVEGEIEALRQLAQLAPDKLKRRAAQTLVEKAEYFRRADQPGHATWYAQHLHAAAFSAKWWIVFADSAG